jgi:thiol-disulfide isomerase/thioredoxin
MSMPSLESRTRRTIIFAAAAVVAAALGGYFALRQAPPRQDASALLQLSLPDASGKEQSLAQWRGKVVVVNFWATWCAPCREEMPEFIRTQNELGAQGLQFVGIAVDQADKVDQFAKELGVNYPTLIGGFGAVELSKTLGNRLSALPFTIVIDRQGKVAHTQLGQLHSAELHSIVGKLL